MLPRLRSFWQTIWNRSRFERDLDDEMRFHLEARMEDLVRSGFPRKEARRRAQIEFGSTEAYQDCVRETRRVNWFEDLAQDLRYGLRGLRKGPGLMLVAVLTLSLGVGASSWLFSMLRQWVIEAVSFPHPERLEVLWRLDTKKGWNGPFPRRTFSIGARKIMFLRIYRLGSRTNSTSRAAQSRSAWKALASRPTFSACSACNRRPAATSSTARTSSERLM